MQQRLAEALPLLLWSSDSCSCRCRGAFRFSGAAAAVVRSGVQGGYGGGGGRSDRLSTAVWWWLLVGDLCSEASEVGVEDLRLWSTASANWILGFSNVG